MFSVQCFEYTEKSKVYILKLKVASKIVSIGSIGSYLNVRIEEGISLYNKFKKIQLALTPGYAGSVKNIYIQTF